MSRMQILRGDEPTQWRELLSTVGLYDVYHGPAYHALAEREGEGAAHLFCYSEGCYSILVPLLLRRIEDVPGLESAGNGWLDATSVYGYAGPVASHADIPSTVRANFGRELQTTLEKLNVVSVFSRLHPLLPQLDLLAGLGDVTSGGHTVSIDLTLAPEEQFARYRNNHKRTLKKLDRLGATCVEDETTDHLDDFVAIYHETMRRVDAAPQYFFPHTHFADLLSEPDFDMHLFVAELDGQLIAAGLFSVCGGIAQYQFGGTSDEFLKQAPMKLVMDTARRWATRRGLSVLHLGGGLGASDDSLFHFKAGFSDRTHSFHTWRWILLPDVHARLCAARLGDVTGGAVRSSGYFPAYRGPLAEPEVVRAEND